ncbi:MAG: type II toxin-antitoxin system RelE/ParE family toxin [Microcystaceae cyanobacterium]
MNLEFRQTFKKDLRKLSKPQVKRQIQTVIEEIESVTSLTELRNIKAIQGHQGFYRIRIGNYRLLHHPKNPPLNEFKGSQIAFNKLN